MSHQGIELTQHSTGLEAQLCAVSKSSAPLRCCGRKVAIFVANTANGQRYGWHYAAEGAVVGDRFHYDHGAGIQRNTDGQYIWTASLVSDECSQKPQ